MTMLVLEGLDQYEVIVFVLFLSNGFIKIEFAYQNIASVS